MRILAVGFQPVGVIAIGFNATGILAVGELATGVVAIGQLARGGIAVGQLALGLIAIGQLSVGVCWSTGQIGIGATSGPGFVAGLFGRLFPLRLIGRRPGEPWRPAGPDFDRDDVEVKASLAAQLAQLGIRMPRKTPALMRWPMVARVAVMGVIAAVWWYGAGAAVGDALTRSGGILVDAPLER